MINRKQYLNDNRVRLSGFDDKGKRGEENRKRGDEFMREFIANTTQHPFNSSARIIGDAHVVVFHDGDGVHIKDIQSHQPGSGAGSRALRYVNSLADKHKLPVNLYAKGYASTKTSQLKNWYKRHGFVPDDDGAQEMTRAPKD